MVSETERSRRRVADVRQLADDMKNDPRKDERLKRHECRACFYSSRIGGAAMTTRPCMSCGEVVMYSSTATDVLCLECANEHALCKRCGGDLEMGLGAWVGRPPSRCRTVNFIF